LIPARSTGKGGVIAIVVALIVGIGVSCNGFREDEVECEQAVNRLKECCPVFNSAQLDCSYSERLDCSDNVTGRQYPALSLDESRCVQNLPCAALVDTGVCARAQSARSRVVSSDSTTPSSAPTAPVCR